MSRRQFSLAEFSVTVLFVGLFVGLVLEGWDKSYVLHSLF
jgi:hypothetical protein